MPDQTTFEARLADAYGRYVAAAPVVIDARAMAASAATVVDAQPRRLRGLLATGVARRLRLPVALLLATAALVSAAIIGSNLRPVVTPPEVTATPRPEPTDVPAPEPTVIAEYEGIFDPIGGAPSNFGADTLVQLLDGRVLGLGNSWPERNQQSLWDPAKLRFSAAGLLAGKRQDPVAVRLLDGRVLIIGGDITEPITGADGAISGEATYSTAEIYDPATGAFTSTGAPVGRSWGPSAALLADGRVLMLDGISVDDAHIGNPQLATAEIFDPATGTFTATGSMSHKRAPTPVLLRDGRVLVVGGTFPESGVAELFDPSTGTFRDAGSLPEAGPHPAGGRYWPEVANSAAMLSDGRVLIAGRGCQEEHTILPDGRSEGWHPTAASIFDPTTDTFSAISPMPHCVERAFALPNGEVLLTGFWYTETSQDNFTPHSQVHWSGLYDPGTGLVRETEPPAGARYVTGVVLADGRVLFLGSRAGTVAELFR